MCPSPQWRQMLLRSHCRASVQACSVPCQHRGELQAATFLRVFWFQVFHQGCLDTGGRRYRERGPGRARCLHPCVTLFLFTADCPRGPGCGNCACRECGKDLFVPFTHCTCPVVRWVLATAAECCIRTCAALVSPLPSPQALSCSFHCLGSTCHSLSF